MRFGDYGRGTSRDGGDINFVELPELACQAFNQVSKLEDRDFNGTLIQAAIERSDSQLPFLQNQKNISESIRIDALVGDPKALLLAISMLEKSEQNWGVEQTGLLLAVSEGIADKTERILQEAQAILDGKLIRLYDLETSNDTDNPVEASDLIPLDNNKICKIANGLNPRQFVESFRISQELSRKVDEFLDATWFTVDRNRYSSDNVIPLPAKERAILVFLKEWFNRSSQIDGSINLINLPRQKEVTDRIIWLCGKETPEGKEAAVLIADLLPRCGLIGDNGEVSKNAKWLLTALREHVSLLIQEEAMESRSLNTSDYHPSS